MSMHRGSCHCGAVTFEVEADDLSKTTACNCSMCGRAGAWMVFVPGSHFQLKTGQDQLTDYQFGPKRIHHPFCKVCGIKPFAHGQDGKGNDMIAVNVRCVEGLDLRQISPTWFDGASL